MYSVTNGNPRHIVSYLYSQCNFSVTKQEVSEQYERSRGQEVVAVAGVNAAEQVDKSILNFVLKKSCDNASNVIVRLGLAYCTKCMGDAQFKISSLYYVNKAVENICDFVGYEGDWQRLEAITLFVDHVGLP